MPIDAGPPRSDERLVLLAPDPATAWRAHADASAWRTPRREARVFLSSRRAAATFGVAGPTTTLERWARTPPTVVATPQARRRALLAAVASEPAAAGGATATPADAAGFALVAGPAVRELLRFADVGAPPAGLDPRLARWWRVAARYRAALDATGSVDPAEVLRRAAARARRTGIPTAARPPVAVLGHLDLDVDEVDAIDALAGPGSVVVLPHDPPWTDASAAARADLRERGWRELVVAGTASWPQVEALAPPTLEAEARWAVAEAKRLLAEGASPDEVVLAARDVGAYAAAVRAAARAAGLALRVDRWLPLSATAVGAPVMAWLEAVAQRGAFEPTLAWLAHPRVARLSADAIDALRRWRPADARAWERGEGGVGATLAWPDRERPGAWRELLQHGWRGLGLAPTVDPASDEVAAAPAGGEARGASSDLDDDGDCGEGGLDPADPFTDPALRGAWRDALDALDDLADASGRVGRQAVLATLRDALRAESVRDDDADTGAGPVVTLHPLEALADARVPHVLLLGAVDGGLPSAAPDDPVLGFHDRAALAAAGVPLRTAGAVARREALRFWGVRRAAIRRLWIGVPAQTGRDARLPSPYLARLGLTPRAVGEPPPASPAAFRVAALRAVATVPDAVDAVLAGARRAHAQALAREIEPRWGPDDGFPGLGVDPDAGWWSATELHDLGTCRFRWWVRRSWRVAAPEEAPTELTPLVEGRLYHGALEGALGPALGLAGPEARSAALAALDEAFAAAERRERVADVVPHWARRRDQHLAHLRGLLAAPAFLPDAHEVAAIELRFEGAWHGWRVRGRVDRIDRTPDGLRLIDYKLGSGRPLGARDAEMEPTLDLQLPLYVDVAAPGFAPGERVAGAVYLSLRKMGEVRARPPEPVELHDLFERLRASLRAGFFPVEPHDAVCRRCDLELVCRKGPHLDHKPPTHRVPGAGGMGTGAGAGAGADPAADPAGPSSGGGP
jgi:RecB family exonuclease